MKPTVSAPRPCQAAVAAALGALLAAASLILVTQGQASPSATPAGPGGSSLSSVTLDAGNHITATWSLESGDENRALNIHSGPDADADGCLSSPQVESYGPSSIGVNNTSYTTFEAFGPGTYYVQLVYRDFSPGGSGLLICSNVLSVTVPETGGGDGGGGGDDGGGGDGDEPDGDLGVPGLSATATDTEGAVTVKHADGTSEALGAGSVLSEGDIITTDRSGRAVVTFSDGSTAKIGHNSSFRLNGARGFKLTRGAISAEIKKPLCRLLGKGCRIATNVVVASVRGTTFTTEARKRVTRVRTYEGAVALRNTRGKPKRTVVVKKGYEGIVRGANPPVLARAG